VKINESRHKPYTLHKKIAQNGLIDLKVKWEVLIIGEDSKRENPDNTGSL
jgi:hypothetical protein